MRHEISKAELSLRRNGVSGVWHLRNYHSWPDKDNPDITHISTSLGAAATRCLKECDTQEKDGGSMGLYDVCLCCDLVPSICVCFDDDLPQTYTGPQQCERENCSCHDRP